MANIIHCALKRLEQRGLVGFMQEGADFTTSASAA
jgi:hypothetical protein